MADYYETFHGGYHAGKGPSAHSCNCIGCCPKCGTCRTWHGHTPDYCDLLVRQAAERSKCLAAPTKEGT